VGRRRGRLRPARTLAPVTLLWTALLGGFMTAPAAAHPLGNFTTNTAAAVVVTPDAVEVAYVVDLAEIPALRVVQALDADGSGAVEGAEGDAHRARECTALAAGLDLSVDGRAADLAVAGTALAFPPGEAGLPTLRLTCDLRARAAGRVVELRDGNLEGRVGWREVTATGRGVALEDSDVPAVSPSGGLRRYPQERLAAPLDVRAARLVVGPGAGGAGADGRGGGLAGDEGGAGALAGLAARFTGLVAQRDLTPVTAAVGVVLAVLLGGLHAVAPGHGKTVMAAVLVSRDGRGRDALALALTVAVAHTLGVLALGAVLTVTEVLAPQQLYAWLGLASGLLFAAVGASLLRAARHPHTHDPGGHTHGPSDPPHAHAPLEGTQRAATLGAGGGERARTPTGTRISASAPAAAARQAAVAVVDPIGHADTDGHAHTDRHVHAHAPSHAHAPGHGEGNAHGPGHQHGTGHAGDHHGGAGGGGGVRWRSLVGPGLAGGMVPTPSALVVLLGGIALDRTWFGVALVVAYGLGMAGVLVGAGWLLLRARDAVPGCLTGGRAARALALLPRATAALVVVAGLLIAVRAVADLSGR